MRSCSATRDPRRDNGSRSVRGRQSASPRIPGGLVSPDQGKRSRASPDGIRDTPTGSKRAATPVAWPACRDLPELGSHLRKLTLASASIGRLPARQVVSVGRQDADAGGHHAARPRRPRACSTSQPGSVASCSASRGSRCSIASRSPTAIDSACAVVSQAAGCEDWMASTNVATGRFEWSRRSWGYLGWPGFVTIQRRRSWSRLATG